MEKIERKGEKRKGQKGKETEEYKEGKERVIYCIPTKSIEHREKKRTRRNVNSLNGTHAYTTTCTHNTCIKNQHSFNCLEILYTACDIHTSVTATVNAYIHMYICNVCT